MLQKAARETISQDGSKTWGGVTAGFAHINSDFWEMCDLFYFFKLLYIKKLNQEFIIT